MAGFHRRILECPENTKKRQTQAAIRRILLSKLQHANTLFAFCVLQTPSEKISRKNEEEKSSTIHASQSPVGYYHVLNCELQTQAVLKQEQKEKADGFFLHPVKLFLNASVCSLLPSWHSHANDPFSVILRKIFDLHPPSHSKCQNT